jgi:O-antigen/teichoic acid export membrane protein
VFSLRTEMSVQLKVAKNVMATWGSLFTHLAVGFFLSPYILHRLGDEAFGVWILIVSVTGYYSLLDLGIRQSVVRYVAKFAANGDDDQLHRFVNTCLFTYAVIAVIALLATGICAWYLPAWFRIPLGLHHTARMLVLLVGTGAALNFPLSVLAGILSGLQDFVRPHGAQIGVSLLRGFCVLMILHWGGGLLALACVTVGLGLLGNALLIFFLPATLHLQWRWRFVDPQSWRAMIGYSSAAFLVIVAEKLRFQSDAVVIGTFLSSTAITYFAIGSKLVEYSTAAVQGMSQIFTPMSSQFEATGDLRRLRAVFVMGNRACALVIFPICLVLVILGKPIIMTWVGAKYLASYSILLVLLLPKTLYLAQASSVKILLGVGKHQRLATVLLMEGGANLILSAILVRPLGIMGVALGTALPLLGTSLIFLPRHLCHMLDVPLSTYARQAYLLPLGLCVPPGVILLACCFIFPAHSRGNLCVQIAAAGAAYAAGLAWLFLSENTIQSHGLTQAFRGLRQQLLQGE